jgi:ribonuclease-3
VSASHSDWPQRWVSEALGHAANDRALFVAALTHRSAAARNNERLEFLGDAVLNLLVAEMLYTRFPSASEGDLSRLRASLVSSRPLATIAQRIGLGEELQLGSGELKTGGFRRESILADAFEATVGAVYLDGGLDAARAVVQRFCQPLLEALPQLAELKDPKTRLQEWLQSRGMPLPTYVVEQVTGEPHDQHFAVLCEVPSLELAAPGTGSSRRRAEQDAAQRVLGQIAERQR